MIACGRGRPPGHAAAAHCAIRAPASGLPAPRWRAAPAVATATRHVGGAVADGSFPPDARAYSGHSASSSASREEPSLHRRGGRDVCARVGKRSRGTGWGGRRSQPGAGDFRVAGEPIGRETALYRLFMRFAMWFHEEWLMQDTAGSDNLPKGVPLFIVASNHQSHLDTSALYVGLMRAGVRKVYALGAKDYFWPNPFIRWFVTRFMCVIPISRKGFTQKDVDVMLDLMASCSADNPAAVVMFPEGTRSRSGQMRRFKTGIGYLAAKLGAPVVPAHVLGTNMALPKLRVVPIRHGVRVRFGPPHAPPAQADDGPARAAAPAAAAPVRRGAAREESAVMGAAAAAAPTRLAVATSALPDASPEPAPTWKEVLRAYVDELYDSVRELAIQSHLQAHGHCGHLPRAHELGGRDVEGPASEIPDACPEMRPVWEQLPGARLLERITCRTSQMPAFSALGVVVLSLGSFALRALGDLARIVMHALGRVAVPTV